MAAVLRAREDEARRRSPSPDLRHASRDELVQLVQDRAPQRVPAIRELGRRRDPILLDWAEEETVAEEAGQAAVDVDGVWHPMLYLDRLCGPASAAARALAAACP